MFTLLFFNIEFLSHLQYINADFCHCMFQNHAACCIMHFTAMFLIRVPPVGFFATPPTFLIEFSSNLPGMISGLSLTKVCPLQPIKIINKGTKQEVGSNLSKSLR